MTNRLSPCLKSDNARRNVVPSKTCAAHSSSSSSFLFSSSPPHPSSSNSFIFVFLPGIIQGTSPTKKDITN